MLIKKRVPFSSTRFASGGLWTVKHAYQWHQTRLEFCINASNIACQLSMIIKFAVSITGMIDKSSSSHSVSPRPEFVEGEEHEHRITSRINLVDPTGSEHCNTAQTSENHLKEDASYVGFWTVHSPPLRQTGYTKWYHIEMSIGEDQLCEDFKWMTSSFKLL